jgi:hypothetical protein
VELTEIKWSILKAVPLWEGSDFGPRLISGHWVMRFAILQVRILRKNVFMMRTKEIFVVYAIYLAVQERVEPFF